MLRTIFGCCGNKTKLRGEILPLIPPHKIYIEAFCGSASIFFGKKKSEIEVLNDIDCDLMLGYLLLKKGFNLDEINEDDFKILEYSRAYYKKAHGTPQDLLKKIF